MRVRAGDVIGRRADFWSLGAGASRVQSLQRVRLGRLREAVPEVPS